MLRPTLEDFVVEMPRGAQVIYPKDLAPICMLADIGPGSAGVRDRRRLGRAVDDDAALGRRHRRLRAPRGLRQPGPGQRAQLPRRRPRSTATASSSATATRGSTTRRPFDRVVLDLPEPWQVVPHAERRAARRRDPRRLHAAHHPGAQAREALKGRWIDARTIEVLHRGWHIEGHAVRPDHRMVAHTGFLTVARYLGPGARLLETDERSRPDRRVLGGTRPSARDQGSM